MRVPLLLEPNMGSSGFLIVGPQRELDSMLRAGLIWFALASGKGLRNRSNMVAMASGKGMRNRSNMVALASDKGLRNRSNMVALASSKGLRKESKKRWIVQDMRCLRKSLGTQVSEMQ